MTARLGLVRQFRTPSRRRAQGLDVPHCYKGIILLPSLSGFAIPVFQRKRVAFPYDLPGGKGHDGESPAEAIIRECREELDIDIEPLYALATIDHPFVMGQKMTFMACRHLAGRAINNDPVDHVKLDICAPEEVLRRFGERLPISVKEYIRSLPALQPTANFLVRPQPYQITV